MRRTSIYRRKSALKKVKPSFNRFAKLRPKRRQPCSGSALPLTQLEEDAKRASQRKSELEDRLVQVRVDAQRDGDLITESRELLSNLSEEETQLNSDAANASDDALRAQEDAQLTSEAVRSAEGASRAKADKLSEIRAHRASTQRTLHDAQQRVAKLDQQLADVADEAEKIVRALQEDKTLQAKREALEAARAHAEKSEKEADAAEAATRDAETVLNESRPQLTELEAERTKLDAEAQAIAKMLQVHDQSLWPAIVDSLDVEAGYETALGAAIGDDLDASSDDAAPLYWTEPGAADADASLPEGVAPLLEFVRGPALLRRRLNQIGVVDHADGARLMRQLQPGPNACHPRWRFVALGRFCRARRCANRSSTTFGATQSLG